MAWTVAARCGIAHRLHGESFVAIVTLPRALDPRANLLTALMSFDSDGT